MSPEAQPCHTRGRTAPRPGPSRRGWLSQPDVEKTPEWKLPSESIPRVRPCWPTFCPFWVSGQDQIMLTIPHAPSKADSSQLGRPHHPRPSIQAGGWALLQDHKPKLASLVLV